MIQLIATDGQLEIANEDIADPGERRRFHGEDVVLIYRYPSEEVDTVAWPIINPKYLCGALYDAREMGWIPDESIVLLPDGTEFNIDQD